jgi:uncharacterized protein (DUF1778 family)
MRAAEHLLREWIIRVSVEDFEAFENSLSPPAKPQASNPNS